MGTTVDTLLPLYSTMPMVLVAEVTRVDSAKGAERNGKEAIFGPLQGTRQHTALWSKGKDGVHVLSGPRVEPIPRCTCKKTGQRKLKGFIGKAATAELLYPFRGSAVKDPKPEIVAPTFRMPPSMVSGLHDCTEHSVGLQPQALQNDVKSGAVKEPAPEAVVPTFRMPSNMMARSALLVGSPNTVQHYGLQPRRWQDAMRSASTPRPIMFDYCHIPSDNS